MKTPSGKVLQNDWSLQVQESYPVFLKYQPLFSYLYTDELPVRSKKLTIAFMFLIL